MITVCSVLPARSIKNWGKNGESLTLYDNSCILVISLAIVFFLSFLGIGRHLSVLIDFFDSFPFIIAKVNLVVLLKKNMFVLLHKFSRFVRRSRTGIK